MKIFTMGTACLLLAIASASAGAAGGDVPTQGKDGLWGPTFGRDEGVYYPTDKKARAQSADKESSPQAKAADKTPAEAGKSKSATIGATFGSDEGMILRH